MNLGFEVVAARSKKTDANDDLVFEPMRQRARKEPRKQPSTDEKKVKRRLTKSAVAWSRRDSLDHDTEFVRYVLLSDTEALEASVVRDETTDEPTWAWLVSVIDRKDGGILEFVMSGSASGLDEAKGKADVALDRAEMDMMFDRVGSRKQAASDHQETIWHLTGYLMGYNGDSQPDDDAPFALMVGYAAGADDNEDNKPAQYTRSDLDYVTETEHMSSDDVADFFEKRGSHKEASMPIMVPSIEDLPADREDMAWYEVYSQRRSSGQLVLELEWSGHDGAQAKRVADFFIATDSDVMFVQLTRNAGRETYGVQMTASRKQAAKNYYVFDGYPDENGFEERPLAGPFASAEEASAVLKDVAYPFQFPYGPATVVGDLFIASGLPQMDTQDFINQTLSNKQAGYRYQPDTESSFDVEQYDESPGEPFTNPSGHTYNGPEKAEATGESYVGSRSSSMQREADILNAMQFASLTEQRQLMAELNTIRANRTAARQADRDIDLTAAVIQDRLTPVLTKSMHTTATDWLDEVVKDEDDDEDEKSDKEASREMVAQASVWFKRLSSEVVADRDEFAEQARGKARQLTSSLGVGREAAIASFLDAAAYLRTKQAARPDLEMGEDDYLEDAVETAAQRAMGTGEDSWLEEAYEDRFAFDDSDMDVEGRRKRANELMGYGEGEYVTNAGDDMMMDDMSGMDMDPRYETNASRKHAEWDQSAFDAWMKQVDSKMVGMSGLGASDLPDQPYADWFEDGMSASEAAQLSLSDTADEMGFGGLFGSRKRSSRKVAYLPHEGEGDITNSRGDDFYRYAEDGNTEWFYIYANTLFHLKEFHNIDLTDTFIHLDDGGPGLQMEELVQSAHALEHEGDSGVYGSRKQASLSVQDLLSTVLDSNHGGFGYRDAIGTIEWITAPSNFERDSDAASRGEKHEFPPFSADDVHSAVIEQANRLGLSREELFIWSNSRYARHFGDELTFYDRPLRDTVERYMNVGIIDRLNSQIAEGKRGKRARKQAVMWNDAWPGYHYWATDGDAAVEIVVTDDDGVEASIYDANTPGTDAPWDTFSFSTVEEAKEWSERIIFRNASRHKQAMPSDDLIDVDIEDYMGGDEGPDPDSQSGHAETALPYAGDDMTPAYRETGWTGKRKRRANRKTASGFYDYGGGVVELGVFGGDNQVGNSYGRIFVKQNEDGTYDRVDVGYYPAVNSVMGDEADELIAANEVYVEEQQWEWKGIADPETDENPTSIDYRNDMLMTNVSLAEAERIAESYASDLSARGDHIASRKRGSRKTAQKVRCPECGRVFDLMNESDADEWFSGHDCEG